MEFIKVVEVRPEVSEEGFLRETMIKLAAGKKPIDFNKCKFDDISISQKDVVQYGQRVYVTYKARLGTYEREYYKTKVRVKDEKGQYHTEERVESRRKTVWDRSISSYTDELNEEVYYFNNNDYTYKKVYEDDIKFLNTLLKNKENEFSYDEVSENSVIVNEETLKEVMQQLENARKYKPHFKSDTYKDLDVSRDIMPYCFTCERFPYYELKFTYEGEECKAEKYAAGNSTISIILPHEDKALTSEIDTSKANFFIATAVLWGYYLWSFLLNLMANETKSKLVLFLYKFTSIHNWVKHIKINFPFASDILTMMFFAVISLILLRIHSIDKYNRIRKYNITSLEAQLNTNSLDPLSKEEKRVSFGIMD
ncbi:MAG: hypothetical protein IJJ00_06285 [Erysipelotrichaceae bacterium]|nr:hypothetical protein [Erysipelotrichaceae bacterium]